MSIYVIWFCFYVMKNKVDSFLKGREGKTNHGNAVLPCPISAAGQASTTCLRLSAGLTKPLKLINRVFKMQWALYLGLA